jgi:hypothetical protein
MIARARWLWIALMIPPLVLALPPLERRAHAIHGNDGFLNYAYARSLLLDGDLDFTDDFAAFDALGRGYDFRLTDTPRSPITGRPVNRYGWGSSLLWSPFLLIVWVIERVIPGLTPNGLNPADFMAVRLGSALWGVLGLALLTQVARRRLWGSPSLRIHAPAPLPAPRSATPLRNSAQKASPEPGFALFVAVVLLATTNLGFYFYLHPSMSTAPAFGLAGSLIWLIDRFETRPSVGAGFGIGLTAALLFCTRYGDAGFLIGLAPALAVAVLPGAQRATGNGQRILLCAAGLLGVSVPLVIQGLIWHSLYGSAFSGPAPYLSEAYQWSWPGRHGWQVLFSGHHGWIAWHPMVAVGLIGLVMMARDRSLPLWLRLTPLAAVGEWLTVSAWPNWTGGASFGGRLMATALAVVFLGLAVALRWMWARWGRGVVFLLVGLLSLWNLGIMAEYGLGLIPRQAPVSMGQMALELGKLVGALFR